ncbi:hypothetical protein [Nitrospira sp. BLG_2]|uniref:hypothetical protein n=1 Tax=Nitrospira sp. BLG_2 TaxID=3397507 RepID=UPI003B9B5FC1
MRPISKVIGLTFLTVVFSMGMSTLALSVDREVYDKQDVQSGKIIKGKVMKVDEKFPQSWNVSVKDQETGEIVILHVDKTTARKDIMLKPDLGDNVVAKYNQQNNHAVSFLTDQAINR